MSRKEWYAIQNLLKFYKSCFMIDDFQYVEKFIWKSSVGPYTIYVYVYYFNYIIPFLYEFF